jgi:hypothetical protein
MGIQWKDGYSARVAVHLRFGEKSLQVAQIGPGSFILREPCVIPRETSATIVIQVDEHKEERPVFLHRGATQNSREVEYI